MDDFTAIRKNIQCNLRPDLNAITNIKPMSLRKQSLGGPTLLQQAIDIHTLKTLNNNSAQGQTQKRIQTQGSNTNRQESLLAFDIYKGMDGQPTRRDLKRILETNSSKQQALSKESILEYSKNNPDLSFCHGEKINQMEQDTEEELKKFSSRLKDKIKEKKTQQKMLQDSIIHDKIAHLLKNNKLSKKDKNQLQFLKKLEQRIAAKTGIEDLNLVNQFTKKRNRFQTVETSSKTATNAQFNYGKINLKANLIYNE